MTTPTVELVTVSAVRPGDTLVTGSALPVLPRACLVVDMWVDDRGDTDRVTLQILDSVTVDAGLDEIRERVFSYAPGSRLRRMVRGETR